MTPKTASIENIFFQLGSEVSYHFLQHYIPMELEEFYMWWLSKQCSKKSNKCNMKLHLLHAFGNATYRMWWVITGGWKSVSSMDTISPVTFENINISLSYIISFLYFKAKSLHFIACRKLLATMLHPIYNTF